MTALIVDAMTPNEIQERAALRQNPWFTGLLRHTHADGKPQLQFFAVEGADIRKAEEMTRAALGVFKRTDFVSIEPLPPREFKRGVDQNFFNGFIVGDGEQPNASLPREVRVIAPLLKAKNG